MSLKPPFDLLDFDSAIPTTAEDVLALRRRPSTTPENWLEQLQQLADQFPASYEELKKRSLHVGFEPFKL